MSPDELASILHDIVVRLRATPADDRDTFDALQFELEAIAAGDLSMMPKRLTSEAAKRLIDLEEATEEEVEAARRAALRLLAAAYVVPEDTEEEQAPPPAEVAAPAPVAAAPVAAAPVAPAPVAPAPVAPAPVAAAPVADAPVAPVAAPPPPASEPSTVHTAAPSSGEVGAAVVAKLAELGGGYEGTPVVCDEDRDLVIECIDETFDNITAAENSLLELELAPDDRQLIDTVFRAFHTIKGIAGFLKLTPVGELAHASENLLSRFRDGELRYEANYPTMTLKAVDFLRRMTTELQEEVSNNPAAPAIRRPEGWHLLVDGLRDAASAAEGGAPAPAASAPVATEPAPVAAPPPVEATPAPAEEEPEEVAPAAPAAPERPEVDEATFFGPADDESPVESAAPAPETTPKAPAAAPAAAPVAAPAAATPAEPAPPRGRSRHARRPRASKTTGQKVDPFVRVRTDRLDQLLDTVGELVIAQSMVAQDPDLTVNPSVELQRKVAHAGKIVRELQDLATSLRMVPLKATFQRMGRVVRDIGKKVGKNVVLETAGEDTEIDRNLVDAISEPLIHMVRNAVDHGIEHPSERVKAGKSAAGTVRLSAYHEGGHVVVELSDDGKGLDRERILEKAINSGVISPHDSLKDEEVLQLIFAAGLSTASAVTDVSGRGVSMDVVRRNIEALNGRVGITSEPGKGSTFTISLPLTLAITDGMIVSVGDQRFIIPTLAIAMSFQPARKQLHSVQGRGEMVVLRGDPLPIVRLHDVFSISTDVHEPSEGLLVVIQDPEGPYALLVDRLLGQQQVVTKSLGEGIGHVSGLSGGAILADGRVGLIIDPSAVGESARGRRSGVRRDAGLSSMSMGF